MQARGKVINKLALVLLSIVVLELVLIGDQVQPVKAIKKKIYLKKLKKILPFLALVKPKKKLILVPIPIPMFKKEPFRNHVPQAQQHMTMNRPMSVPGSNHGAMSFMMIDPSMPTGPTGLGEALPMDPSQMMTMPSMTMTIQSDGIGTMSAIELTPGASSASNSTARPSGALITAGKPGKWNEQQQLLLPDFQLEEQFSMNEFLQPIKQQRPNEGDLYYASPWAPPASGNRPPLVSPAKFVRNGRLRQQLDSWTSSSPLRPAESKLRPKESGGSPREQAARQQTIALITTASNLPPATRQQGQKAPTQTMPIVTIKSQWRHAGVGQQPAGPATTGTMSAGAPDAAPVSERIRTQQLAGPKLSKQQEQQIASALEQESLVQVGPTRLIPIYQSANGRISMTPPPSMTPAHTPDGGNQAPGEHHANAELNAEVQTNEASHGHLKQPQDHLFEHDSPSEAPPKPANERSKRPPVEGVKRVSGSSRAGAYH